MDIVDRIIAIELDKDKYSIEDLIRLDIAIKFNSLEEFYKLMKFFKSNGIRELKHRPRKEEIKEFGINFDYYMNQVSLEFDDLEEYVRGVTYSVHKIISVNEIKGYK